MRIGYSVYGYMHGKQPRPLAPATLCFDAKGATVKALVAACQEEAKRTFSRITEGNPRVYELHARFLFSITSGVPKTVSCYCRWREGKVSVSYDEMDYIR